MEGSANARRFCWLQVYFSDGHDAAAQSAEPLAEYGARSGSSTGGRVRSARLNSAPQCDEGRPWLCALSYDAGSWLRLVWRMNYRVKESRASKLQPTSTSKSGAAATAGVNHLLAALPDEEFQRWEPLLELVDLPLGLVLYESGQTLRHVYFPTTAIVSLIFVLEDGNSEEIAVVGNEGVVGVSIFMGGGSTPSRAVVQSAGRGFRLRSSAIKEAFGRNAPVMHLMLRYTQALIAQMTQTAVCNRHHTVDKQFCRWLLLSLDRLQGHELVMTQDLIANMLGVRREVVTEAALKLQTAGLIQYARGRITVLDRPGLEHRSCECYAVVKKEYDRLLPDTTAV